MNLHYPRLLDSESGVVVPPEETERLVGEAGASDDKPIITFCGGGLAAAFVAFALTMAGRSNVAVYNGSLLEWATDPDMPLDVG